MTAPRRPKWLPANGPGNLNVSPANWGMTLMQWAGFIMACKSCTATWALCVESEERKRKGDVNLYQICDLYVKPWTRNMGNSIALLLNGAKPLKAHAMISHAWGEDIIESMIGVLGRSSVMGMSLDAPIWFCTFAQYQPGDMDGDCGPGVAAQLALDPFKQVIDSNPHYGMLVIHTSAAELYGRLWCVYEVNASQDACVRPHAAMSMRYLEYCLKRLDSGHAIAELCACSAAEAACWSADDEKRIKAQIEAGIGYDELNKRIFAFRSDVIKKVHATADALRDWSLPTCTTGDPEEVNLNYAFRKILRGLVETVRAAGTFVGLHCLWCLSLGGEDDHYRQAIMNMARAQEFGPEKYDGGRDSSITAQIGETDMMGRDLGLPPGFDPKKRKPDEFLVRLQEEDELLKECLADLSKFQHPVGWIELGAGGKIAAEVVAEMPREVDEIKRMFMTSDADGDGTISIAEMTAVLTNLSGGDLSEADIALLFMAADKNQDGRLQMDEFLDWLCVPVSKEPPNDAASPMVQATSAVIRIENILAVDEKTEKDEYQWVMDDMYGGCRAHGKVDGIFVVRPEHEINTPGLQKGDVYLKCASVDDATKIMRAMGHKDYMGLPIQMSSHEEDKYQVLSLLKPYGAG